MRGKYSLFEDETCNGVFNGSPEVGVDSREAFFSVCVSKWAVRAAGDAGEAFGSHRCPCPSAGEPLAQAGPFSQRLSLHLVSVLLVWAAALLSIRAPTMRRSGEGKGARAAAAAAEVA